MVKSFAAGSDSQEEVQSIFDEDNISQCLQDGLLHIFSCVCQIKRAIEENDELQSLQLCHSIGCGAARGGARGGVC